MTSRKQTVPSIILFGLIACVLYGLGAEIRSDIGILLNPLAEHAGLSYENVSTCIAFMQLVFGVSQPFFGIVASQKSNRFVLRLRIGFLGLSMVGMMTASSYLMLFLSLIAKEHSDSSHLFHLAWYDGRCYSLSYLRTGQ